jgi:hypothetical protein
MSARVADEARYRALVRPMVRLMDDLEALERVPQ